MQASLRVWVLAVAALFAGGCASHPVPRPEHPRPDLARDQWLSLNGAWDFRFDPADRGESERWVRPATPFDRDINVPFCWESPLSGVEVIAGHEIGWYRRDISVPSDWEGRRVWLRFEAVNSEATVWVNETQVGAHTGDAVPFAFDITDQAPPGSSASVVVRVYAPPSSDTSLDHTPTSGIWQTVWLEARPDTYLESVSLTPRNDAGHWLVDFVAVLHGDNGTADVTVSSSDANVVPADGQATIADGTGEFRATLAIDAPRVWTPSTPEIYELEIEVASATGARDTIHSYFPLRTFGSAAYEGAAAESLLLNGEPVALRCAKDYSRNPQGLSTAPTDEFLRHDLELARSFGLNCLVAEGEAAGPRGRLWADQLGILVLDSPAPYASPSAPTTLLPGGGDRDVSWNLRTWMTSYRGQVDSQVAAPFALADFEFSHDGLLNYDRSPKESGYAAFVENMTVADLLGDDFVGFETPSAVVAEPGSNISVPIFVSHFSGREGEIMIHPWLVGVDDLGGDIRLDFDLRPVTWQPYGVTPQRPIGVALPAGRGFVGALALELLAEGERIGANFVNIVALRPPPAEGDEPIAEPAGPRRAALRRSPLAPSRIHWSGDGVPSLEAQRASGLEKLYFHGAGIVEYQYDVPAAVLDAGPLRLGVLLELATKARDQKLDWPQLSSPLDYPQTDARKLPGTVQVYINGEYLDPIQLADDPADSRGVLSHMAGVQHGSYGYLVRGELLLQDLPALAAQLRRSPVLRLGIEVLDTESANGLSVYGARSGLYPIAPTLIIETQRDIAW